MLIRLAQQIVRLTFDDEPVTEAGRLFVPRSGERYIRRLVPQAYHAGRWEPLPFMPRITLGGRLQAAFDITASGAFVPQWTDILDTTQLAFDGDLETHKVAIFGSSTTPNFSSDTAYGSSPYDTDEKSGGSWPSGGVAVTGTAFDESPAGSIRYDATDVSQATSTFTGGEGSLFYNDSGSDEAIFLHDFGTTASPNNGTMEIQWATTGMIAIDCTP
jgi:hypothetical protein